MALYEVGGVTSATASGAALAEFRAPTSAQRAYVREIGLSMHTAVATVVGLGRSGAIGVTPTSPITGLQEDTADVAPGSQTAVAWATAPTQPTNWLRRFGMPATVGAGIVWTWWNRPLVVPIAASLVIANLAGAVIGTIDFYIVWEE